jgi:CheY-like chemotaxis protein
MATVLVVEDDADTRDLLSRYLEFMGHRALTAGDGLAAMALLDREQADLILLDIMMPTMDGAMFLQAIRGPHLNDGPPVVVCTAMNQDHLEKALGSLPKLGVIRKTDGFFIDLVEAVAQQLGSRLAAPSAVSSQTVV